MSIAIARWKDDFENHRSREIRNPSWVSLPILVGSDSYCELVAEHEDGPAHWGVFCALVILAQRSPVRGVLLRDGGQPHTVRTIARQIRMPAALVEEAITRLSNELIGWLTDDRANVAQQEPEAHDDAAQTSRERRASTAQPQPEPRGVTAATPRSHRANAAGVEPEPRDEGATPPRQHRANAAQTPRGLQEKPGWEGRGQEGTGGEGTTANARAKNSEAQAGTEQSRKTPTSPNGKTTAVPKGEFGYPIVRAWLGEYVNTYGELSEWGYPDEAIVNAVILAAEDNGYGLTDIQSWLQDLGKRRRRPEQSYGWFVTLAAGHFAGRRAAQGATRTAFMDPNACPTCGAGSGASHAGWCGMADVGEIPPELLDSVSFPKPRGGAR